MGHLVLIHIFISITLHSAVYATGSDQVWYSNDGSTNPISAYFREAVKETIQPAATSSLRSKRNQEHHVNECIYMTLEEGEFYSKATAKRVGETCGIYITTEPDHNIEIKFNFLNVPCENGGLVVVVDGWELSGEYFPNPEDHDKSLKSRFNEFCGRKKIKRTFVSSQNVALIQYRLPFRGASFSCNVRFVKNLTPCNVLLQPDETYTLRNYGRRVNCTISSLFPAVAKVLNINIGVASNRDRALEYETGTIYKCQKRGLDDFVQIGGSSGLDNYNLQVADSLCGLNSRPEKHIDFIACETTTIRLVSTGNYDNSVTIFLRKLEETDIMSAHMSIICNSQAGTDRKK